MRYVLDTDELVAGLHSRTGASRRLLALLYEGRYQAVVSVPLMLEYEAVLTRPENLKAFGLSSREMVDTCAEMLIWPQDRHEMPFGSAREELNCEPDTCCALFPERPPRCACGSCRGW